MARTKSDYVAQIEQEHGCLRRDIKDIEAAMMEQVDKSSFGDWRLQMIWRLRDLKNHLQKHFELEDISGFMEDVINQAPHAASKVERLADEHVTFVTDLDTLLAQFEGMSELDPDGVAQVRQRIGKFIVDLQRHERAEDELMQIAYCQEFGYPA